ncbi:M13 family metallopeptidase [Roseateles sp. BYS87W]|uniref:M13 family metallopeptidase n=1 Tax=Pelomonas baiyunensis TaxID=3299026 RepID=A0ABW7H0P4_9BURK
MNTPRLAPLALSLFLSLPVTLPLASLPGVATAAPPTAAPLTSGFDKSGQDRTVRPQDDLFRAGNGRWLATTRIPADKSAYGSFTQLADLSDERVRRIVESLAATQRDTDTVEGKIGAYYASHLNTAAIDKAGLAPIRPMLDSIAALQTREQLAPWLGRHVGVVDLPWALSVDPDFKQPGTNRLSLSQSGLGLPDRDYYLKTDDAEMARARDAYRRYLAVLARAAGLRQPDDAARRVIVFEHRLAQAQWPADENRDPQKNYNPMTPAELAKNAPGWDWAAMFGAAALPTLDRLSVAQPSYATAAAQWMAEAPLEDIRLYLTLRVLDAHATVLPRALRDASFAFHGAALTGARSPRPRWQQAVESVNAALGEAVGEVYVQRHFAAADKARMLVLVQNLLTAYGESIDSLTWMTPATQAKARDKLSKYLVKIGYPDVWRRYDALQVKAGDAAGNRQRAARFDWERQAAKAGQPVDKREWGMTPQTVNAYYNPTLNEIVFPAAILQPPFYNTQADDAVNYGAIGAIIGHEISHGFDDEGSQFDGDGVLANWWTDDDRKAFEAVGARLEAQYEGYEPLPGKRINGKLTLGENMADLSGLQIAYKAYQRSLGGQPSPVIDGLTGEQRFFMGWSQGWREKIRDPRLLQQLTVDPHSPPQFRANGAAVNHDGFHDAFKTQPGDKMFKAPADRIKIW